MVGEAGTLGVAKLFAFTYAQGFFEKVGFEVVEHSKMPHKVFNDCLHCPKFMACDEIAMERVLFEPRDPATNFGLPVTQFPIPQRTRK
jgi:N-acetylglutamate synthase-like GNAT family acetyltransferase